MWGADGAVIPTVKNGNVTLFIVAEHWNAEGLGWHVAKHGNRYAAAEALALAVSQVFGSVRADAARGCCCVTTTAAPSCPSTSRTSSPSSA
jgi:putative transposase